MEDFINSGKAKELLDGTLEKAKTFLDDLMQDGGKLDEFLDKIQVEMKNPDFEGILDDIKLLFEMMKCYIKKEYTDVSSSTIVTIVGAFLYWLSPIDVIPDKIAVLGHVDDIAVLVVCFKLLGPDIEKFEEWKKIQG